MDTETLIEMAYKVTGEYKSNIHCLSGSVGAALVTKENNVYTGVCIDSPCGMGFCAEHAAIAEMLKNKESVILSIVAVDTDKNILAPCGRCREFIYQVNKENRETNVILQKDKIVKLRELLPYPWLEY